MAVKGRWSREKEPSVEKDLESRKAFTFKGDFGTLWHADVNNGVEWESYKGGESKSLSK